MRVFAVIAGLLVIAFGGGCLALVNEWGSWLVTLLGWLPILTGLGLVGYSIFHKRGVAFPLPVKVIVWVIVLAFAAAFIFLFVGVVFNDFRIAG